MPEKFKEAIDRGNQFEAFLTYLSKAFDCIDHNFLIANSEPKIMTVLELD